MIQQIFTKKIQPDVTILKGFTQECMGESLLIVFNIIHLKRYM